jgi:nucleotide-binding universal stress UspA family protein
MEKQHRILFPIDFSECSSQLADDILNFAEKFDSEIHMIYVVRAFGYYSTLYVTSSAIQEIEDSVMTGAEKSLIEFKHNFFSDYPKLRHKILHGDAAEEIIRYASVYEIDLIIMGTHGRKALEKILLGSVAQRVVQSSPVPVLTINPYLRGTKVFL